MLLKNLKKFFLTACLVLSIFNNGYADTLDTKLSSNKVAAGETFTLSFTLEGNANTSAPDFSALNKDFTILSTNYGNAINIINGVSSNQTFWQLTLAPKKTGVLIIPEISFGNVKSSTQQLTVADSPDHITANTPDAPIFVQAQLSTTTPYIQSQVLYTFKIFYQSHIENPRVAIPEMKDATFVELDNGSHYQTTVNGKSYFVVEKNFALFPQKVGNILIPPFHFQALTTDTSQNILNSSLYVSEPKAISLATQSFNLNVKNIPAEFQGKTWLPAKNISLTEKWSIPPEQWEAGNPVTRTITLEAHGLRADQLPDLAIDKIAGVNMYVDPAKRSNTTNDNIILGVLEQKVTYIPNTAGTFTIPALKLNWWDLEKNSNAVAELNSLLIKAQGKIANSAPMQTVKPAALTVAPVSESKAPAVEFYYSIWFWVATGIFVLWLITLWMIWYKKTGEDKNLNLSSQKIKPAAQTPTELSEKSFMQACEAGNASAAQQFLLLWAKQQWQQDIPFDLSKLQEIISDETFKNELKNLEQALYAKNSIAWKGRNLLAAYQKTKKSGKFKPVKVNQQSDPLPPLNPN